jgi:hypothetical protein
MTKKIIIICVQSGSGSMPVARLAMRQTPGPEKGCFED